MDGEIVPLPQRGAGELAEVDFPLDIAEAVPIRSRRQETPRDRTEWHLSDALLLVPNLAKLLFRLLRDSRVPGKRRLAMTVVAAYVVSPIDLVPDFIPVLGTVDDLIILAFAVDYLLEAAPPGVVDEHWDGSEDALELVRGLAGWSVELLPRRLRRLAIRRGL